VEVPHGCPDSQASPACTRGDTGTHLVGVRAFRAANAHYLFINGADRVASGAISDVAHQPESLFEKIHEAAAFMGEGASVRARGSTRSMDSLPPIMMGRHPPMGMTRRSTSTGRGDRRR
jgi:hypothetical protein